KKQRANGFRERIFRAMQRRQIAPSARVGAALLPPSPFLCAHHQLPSTNWPALAIIGVNFRSLQTHGRCAPALLTTLGHIELSIREDCVAMPTLQKKLTIFIIGTLLLVLLPYSSRSYAAGTTRYVTTTGTDSGDCSSSS